MRVRTYLRLFAPCLFTLFLALPAFADKCKEPIVDEGNFLSADGLTRLTTKVGELQALGADVHVQLLTSFHRDGENQLMPSLDAYKEFMLHKCGDWQSADGGMKNSLLFLAVVPPKKVAGLYYGDQWKLRLGGKHERILSDMNARFREGDWAGGMLSGIATVSDLLGVKVSQEGVPLVINHAADTSWLGRVFGWIIAIVVLLLLGLVGVKAFRAKESRRAAQRDAQSERGTCTTYVNSFEQPVALFKAKIAQAALPPEWKSRLDDLIGEVVEAHEASAQKFAALSRNSNNPDIPGLSVEEYQGMRDRYHDLSEQYGRAKQLLQKASAEFARAQRGEPVEIEPRQKTTQSPIPPSGETDSASPRDSSRQSAAPESGGSPSPRHHHGGRQGQTGYSPAPVVIHEDHDSGPGFVTGLVLGEVLGDHDHERVIERETVVRGDGGSSRYSSDDEPVIAHVDPPSQGSGGAADFGRSSDGGGSSMPFGHSSSGGGGSTSFTDESVRTEDSNWGGGSKTSY
jgi:uncharacterized membrane protein YgcG